MFEYDDKKWRNLQEQVAKNQEDIKEIKQSLGEALPDPIPGPEGPVGPKGPQGIQGSRGTGVYGVSASLPSYTAYKEGDFYLLTNGDLYKCTGAGWSLQCNIRGPQGIAGGEGGGTGVGFNTVTVYNEEYGPVFYIAEQQSEIAFDNSMYIYNAAESPDVYYMIGSSGGSKLYVHNLGFEASAEQTGRTWVYLSVILPIRYSLYEEGEEPSATVERFIQFSYYYYHLRTTGNYRLVPIQGYYDDPNTGLPAPICSIEYNVAYGDITINFTEDNSMEEVLDDEVEYNVIELIN